MKASRPDCVPHLPICRNAIGDNGTMAAPDDDLDPADAKLSWRRERLHRQLAETAAEREGRPVCGKALAPDRVCTREPDHRDACEW